jgi:DNA-binding response OmpR family regulator
MKKNVLVVDDDASVQDVFKMIFERAGYTVQVFGDGKAILQLKFNIPDLFILDKQLSGVDGLDICRFLKAEKTTCHIPVIMLSATPHLETTALAAGADAFVEKPFVNKELISLAESFIRSSALTTE